MGGVDEIAEEGEGARGRRLIENAEFPFVDWLTGGEEPSYVFERVSIMRDERGGQREHPRS